MLNADSLGGKVGELLSHNVFAYCKNNGINLIDQDGRNPFALTLANPAGLSILVGIGLVLGAFYLGAMAKEYYNRSHISYTDTSAVGSSNSVDAASETSSSGGGSPSPPNNNDNKGFDSFRKLKKHLGKAGVGKAWHHIVEQTPANVKRFGAPVIHSISNIIKLDHGKGSIHAKISGYYSSIQPFTNGETVRNWLSSKSFEEQYEFGKQVIKLFQD